MSRAHPLRVADYLQHILEAIGNIQDYTAGMDLAVFLADRKTCDAVIRNLEVLGEALAVGCFYFDSSSRLSIKRKRPISFKELQHS